MTKLTEYLWIAVAGGIMGFAYGFLIGANDVANAFASSVSSKSLTLTQAVAAASIFEFSGAFFLGARVTNTIRSKIVDIDLYEDRPDLLMFGMFTALTTAVLMLWGATALGLPVSTTHDIVGCIMGFSIAAKGFDSIHWDVARKLFISWIISPLLSGSVAFTFFFLVKNFVLTAQYPFQRAYYTFPIVIFVGIGIDLFYVLYKGANNTKFEKVTDISWIIPLCFVVGLVCALIWIFIIGPPAKRRIERFHEGRLAAAAAADAQLKDVEVSKGGPPETALAVDDDDEEYFVDEYTDTNDKPKPVAVVKTVEVVKPHVRAPHEHAVQTPLNEAPVAAGGARGLMDKFYQNTVGQDLHAQSMHESPGAARIWEQGATYDDRAEHLFNYVQVFTACLNSFAHGANDVSNTIAPLSAIIHIYQKGTIKSKTGVDKWVLAFGGAAIVIGLLLYGYKVMKSLGWKMTKLSPSRGACAELAASLTVVTASFLEIPVSSTQCICGAVAGVGLVNGVFNVDWLFLLKVCTGWVVMFFMAVTLSSGVFAFATFSPDL